MNYRHTQVGHLMIAIAIFLIGYFAYIFTLIEEEAEEKIFASIVMLAVIFILFSMSTLTVSLDEKYLRIKFGWGIFRKKFDLQNISSAKVVRNRWYNGWGIRRWPFKNPFWLYNVSGFDAVEIELKGGARHRIGTDEPRKLEEALNRVNQN